MSCNSARKPIWSESLSVHLFFICCCWSYISLLGTIRILSDGSEVFKLKSQQVAGGGRFTGWICDSSPGLVMCRLCASFRYSSNKRNISSDWSGCLPVLSLSVCLLQHVCLPPFTLFIYWWWSIDDTVRPSCFCCGVHWAAPLLEISCDDGERVFQSVIAFYFSGILQVFLMWWKKCAVKRKCSCVSSDQLCSLSPSLIIFNAATTPCLWSG